MYPWVSIKNIITTKVKYLGIFSTKNMEDPFEETLLITDKNIFGTNVKTNHVLRKNAQQNIDVSLQI